MFKMVLPSAEYFAKLMKAVSSVTDEGTFKISANGIGLISMDPAHISLVDFMLSKEAMESFEFGSETEITVSISDLMKLLKRAKRGESLELLYNPDEKRLTLRLVDEPGSRERIFQINTLETVSKPPNIPKLNFEATARISYNSMAEAIRDASVASDYVKIVLTPEHVIFVAKSEFGGAETKLLKGGASVFEISAEKEVSASFSINYLDKIVKGTSRISDEVILQLSTNKPIKMGFPIPSGKLEFLVAPRIEGA